MRPLPLRSYQWLVMFILPTLKTYRDFNYAYHSWESRYWRFSVGIRMVTERYACYFKSVTYLMNAFWQSLITMKNISLLKKWDWISNKWVKPILNCSCHFILNINTCSLYSSVNRWKHSWVETPCFPRPPLFPWNIYPSYSVLLSCRNRVIYISRSSCFTIKLNW